MNITHSIIFKIKRDLTNHPEKNDSTNKNTSEGKNRQFTMNYINILLLKSVSGIFYKNSNLN